MEPTLDIRVISVEQPLGDWRSLLSGGDLIETFIYSAGYVSAIYARGAVIYYRLTRPIENSVYELVVLVDDQQLINPASGYSSVSVQASLMDGYTLRDVDQKHKSNEEIIELTLRAAAELYELGYPRRKA